MKIRRLISKHGALGYAVYNFVLEAITEHMETESPIPELEDSAQDIGEYLKMDTVKVEEIMLCCMENGLFEQDELTGRIICSKIYKFLEKASTGSAMLRTMITKYQDIRKYQENPDDIKINQEKAESEQNRTEQNINMATKHTKEWKVKKLPKPSRFIFSPPEVDEVKAYCKERGNSINAEQFIDYYSTRGWMLGKVKMKDWKAAIRTWERNDKTPRTKPIKEEPDVFANADFFNR